MTEPLANVGPWDAFLAGLPFTKSLIGAVMREPGAGLAFPDFPLAGGQVFPPLTSIYMGVHFFHRLGGVLVTLTVWALTGAAFGARREAPIVWRLAHFPAIPVVFQFALGAASVLPGLH